jgi:primosomal protein N' (replication factor Y)
MIAGIIPFARLPKSLSYFDYEVPQNFEGQIKIGQLVKISFKGRKISGIIFKLKDKPAQIKSTLKPIIKILNFEREINFDYLKLLWWMSDYYSVSPALILKTFIPEPPLRLGKFKIKSVFKSSSLGIAKSDIPVIQKNLEKIFSGHKNFFLFYYQNYKNKIAIFLKSAARILNQKKQVLILEPQITDINLILPYFLHLFPNKIAIFHGELSKTEYWQEWQKVKDKKADIIIGTRRAIFAPSQNLGLIMVDDEEMPDFKQSDRNPRYDARIAAVKLAELYGAKLIFASQAPRLETYYQVKEKNYDLLEEKCSPGLPDQSSQDLRLIDMGQELKKKNFLSLSGELQENIGETLEKKQKVVLLLNRRGTSTLVICRDCNYVFKCPSCDLPLVCHEENFGACSKLICHRCGYEGPIPLACPNCRGTSIKFFGTGTQKVEREVKEIFPHAKIARIDKDVKINSKFQFQIPDAEVFVGTQFFIKNYLPQIKNIGLIGVVSADTLLFRPDFRSGEKTFEWLTKIINLSKERKSRILIQTYLLNNFIVQSAIAHNYDDFYKQEIEERQKFNYPPFGKLLKLIYQHKNEKKCAFEFSELSKSLITSFGNEVEILKDEKPKKFKQKFISTIIIKFSHSLTPKIINYLKTIPEGWTIDIDPESLL